MAVHSLGSLLREAFRRCQLLGNQVTVDDFPLLWELREAFRQGQLLSNRIALNDFSLFSRGYFRKPSVGNSCLVTGPPLITFHYFWGVLWKAFHRGRLLGNRVAFDGVALLLGSTLGSLPSGTAA